MLNSNELALRIGLAARSLPGVSTSEVVNALANCLGFPLTAAKLAALEPAGVADAFATFDPPPSADALGRVVRLLKEGMGPDAPQPLSETAAGPAPGNVRVACASNGSASLDGHFGSCRGYAIFDVSVDGATPVGTRFFFPALFQDDDDPGELDKNEQRLRLIADCQILCVRSIGGPAAARVTRAGLMPLKMAGEQTIDAVLEKIRETLAGSPPPWLAKFLKTAPG